MKSRARGKTRIRHRYVPENAYTRGAQTRSRLIVSALKLFGQRGFDGASTREIAAAAGLNAPALQYYFNNKEGLYAACAEHIVAQAWTGMKDVVLAAERLVGGRADDAALIDAFCAIQIKLADFLTDAAGDWLLWIAREEIAPGPARSFRLIHRQRDRIMRVKAAIIARLLRRGARCGMCAARDEPDRRSAVLSLHAARRAQRTRLESHRCGGSRPDQAHRARTNDIRAAGAADTGATLARRAPEATTAPQRRISMMMPGGTMFALR